MVRIKKDERGPVVARLQPAAAVRGLLLHDKGRPLRDVRIQVTCFLDDTRSFRFRHGDVKTDAEGRFSIDGLVPDIKYSAQVSQTVYPREVYPRHVFIDLSLTSGETKDLGKVSPKKARDDE
jgi:hypothetical protein